MLEQEDWRREVSNGDDEEATSINTNKHTTSTMDPIEEVAIPISWTGLFRWMILELVQVKTKQ